MIKSDLGQVQIEVPKDAPNEVVDAYIFADFSCIVDAITEVVGTDRAVRIVLETLTKSFDSILDKGEEN